MTAGREGLVKISEEGPFRGRSELQYATSHAVRQMSDWMQGLVVDDAGGQAGTSEQHAAACTQEESLQHPLQQATASSSGRPQASPAPPVATQPHTPAAPSLPAELVAVDTRPACPPATALTTEVHASAACEPQCNPQAASAGQDGASIQLNSSHIAQLAAQGLVPVTSSPLHLAAAHSSSGGAQGSADGGISNLASQPNVESGMHNAATAASAHDGGDAAACAANSTSTESTRAVANQASSATGEERSSAGAGKSKQSPIGTAQPSNSYELHPTADNLMAGLSNHSTGGSNGAGNGQRHLKAQQQQQQGCSTAGLGSPVCGPEYSSRGSSKGNTSGEDNELLLRAMIADDNFDAGQQPSAGDAPALPSWVLQHAMGQEDT